MAVLLLIGMFSLGEGIPNLVIQPAAVRLEFLALGLILLGIIFGFRWELGGGLISLAGYGLFIGTEAVIITAPTS